jgi:hypothetical protein
MAIVLGLLVLVALLIALGVQSRHRADQSARFTTANGDPDSVARNLALSVAVLRGHTCSLLGPHVLQITARRTPTWAYIVAVLLFPIGLLALLAKTDTSVVITLTKVKGAIAVESAGQLSPELRRALAAAFGPQVPLPVREG